jgi:hypothetical protein
MISKYYYLILLIILKTNGSSFNCEKAYDNLNIPFNGMFTVSTYNDCSPTFLSNFCDYIQYYKLILIELDKEVTKSFYNHTDNLEELIWLNEIIQYEEINEEIEIDTSILKSIYDEFRKEYHDVYFYDAVDNFKHYAKVYHMGLYGRVISDSKGIIVLLNKEGLKLTWKIKLLDFKIMCTINAKNIKTRFDEFMYFINRLHGKYTGRTISKKLKTNNETISEIINEMINCNLVS